MRPPTLIVCSYGKRQHSSGGKNSKPIAEHLVRPGYAHTEDLASAFARDKENIAVRTDDRHDTTLFGQSSGAHLSRPIATDPQYLKPRHLTPANTRAIDGLNPPIGLTPGGYGRNEHLNKDAGPVKHLSPGARVFAEKTEPLAPAKNRRDVSRDAILTQATQ